MSSLRLALKLSMAEIRPSDEKAVKKIKETSLESASLDDILIGKFTYYLYISNEKY